MGDEGVADLLKRLNLTRDEGEVAAISDDEEEDVEGKVECMLLGKILTPSTLHISTIRSAMKSAWGNPFGFKMRSVGEKTENLFIAEFGAMADRQRALAGSPWMVGRHAVILQAYDESLKPSDVSFDKMEIWVRILNLPFGWMNARRGARAAGLIGKVVKLDVYGDGEASGPFLRARVKIEADKPLRRGVMLKTDRKANPDWFDIQFEKLPFFCFSCGVMGHLTLECPNPAPRNALGKLPYEVKLRAPEEKRRKPLSFGQAAAESYGSSSARTPPSGSRQSPDDRTDDKRNARDVEDGEEMISPVKTSGSDPSKRNATPKELVVNDEEMMEKSGARKRKSKGSSSSNPDTNLPALGTGVVPAGMVSERINQLGSASSQGEKTTEAPKKQKTAYNKNARSAAAAGGSPRRAQ
ncbi:uncharacterized protein LOC120678182 [Panicum virgatum]|uniref:uncharacterized protein LOC120678182 n=1 Tax=Panicum virgatum TaxID=38727 RepID=UPI0019D5C034|nr:uncharacterized protein LOC120678182 [Panicum virgatum]